MAKQAGSVFGTTIAARSSIKEGHAKRKKLEDEGSTSFILRNISKLILPPLGVSDSNQTQLDCRARVISPVNSRYRCWETFMVILVTYSAWVYPFESAFMKAIPKGRLLIADNVVNAFFAVGISSHSLWLILIQEHNSSSRIQ